jgi:hypothetical protein
MKHHCNPLLKSWNQYLKDAATFVVLRRYGVGRLGSEKRGRWVKKRVRR